MERRIKVLFLLIGDLYRASCRYRVYQYLPYFQKIEPTLEWSATESKELARKAGKVDLVFIQKAFFSASFLQALRGEGARLVYDFDDAVFLDADFATQVNRQSELFRRFKTMVEHSDLVLAGNKYLAGFASIFNQRVKIVPTTVDIKRYPRKKHGSTGKIVIGWIGHSSNQHYLELLKQPLINLRSVLQHWTFRIISDQPWSGEGLPVEFCQWDLGYVKELNRLDIGVMPLFANDEWAKGKCACKALQYMAAGIPTIVSPVGMNCDIVTEGQNGFFASTAQEWFSKLLLVMIRDDLRCRVGEAGRNFVERNFATHMWAVHLEDLLVKEVRG